MGDRIPTINYYSKKGYLEFVSAVGKNAHYQVFYNIDLKNWYHIEIAQAKMNGKVSEIYNFSL